MQPELKGARILVVDDDPGMLRAVSRILERHHDVAIAATPAAAMEQMVSFGPDLAIIDVHMPEVNGFELMARLHETHPHLDVIIMTGSASEPDAHLIRAIDQGAFYFIRKPFDRRVLQTLVSRCVELRRLQREKHRHLRRLERELAEARGFQRSMLPPERAAMRGAELSARYLACTELAGDFYDYAPAGNDAFAVVVADVAGHGAQAAMMTGVVKSAFHAAHADGYEPLAIVERLVANMRTLDAERFVTLVCARLEPARRTLRYVSAGHPPAILRRKDGATERLSSTGPLISSGFTGLDWEERDVALGTDDHVLLYTDGLTEVRGPSGLYGCHRIVEHVAASPHRGARLLDGLLDEVARFAGRRPYADDITVVTVSLAAPGSSRVASGDSRHRS